MKSLLATEPSSAIVIIMNRTVPLENLNYFILTLVQILFFTATSWAAPNLEPSPSTNTENPGYANEAEEAYMDSLVPSETDNSELSSNKQNEYRQWKRQFSLTGTVYSGPHQTYKSKSLGLFGLNFQKAQGPNRWLHTGFSLGGNLNPLIYLGQELPNNNLWSIMKSWQYLIQLEIDSEQNLGALFSLNHYMMGAGIRFDLSPETDFIINFFPLSIRGIAFEAKIGFLIF